MKNSHSIRFLILYIIRPDLFLIVLNNNAVVVPDIFLIKIVFINIIFISKVSKYAKVVGPHLCPAYPLYILSLVQNCKADDQKSPHAVND